MAYASQVGYLIMTHLVLSSYSLPQLQNAYLKPTGCKGHQQKRQPKLPFSHMPFCLSALFKFVRACIDFDLVADFNERSNRQFKTSVDFGWLHHFA